jgi:predicted ATPase
LSFRSLALWCLGYPEAALLDAAHAVKDVREISQAASLMYALFRASFSHALCGNYATAKALSDEMFALANEKGASFWKALAMSDRGCLLALTGEAADAVHVITSGLSAYRSTGATLFVPWYSSTLARAYAKLGQFDDAWRCIGETITLIQTSDERWCEAEVNRIAGEISLLSTESDATKAEVYFQRAVLVARQQQAKSWELRAAMSLARLRRDQGKVQQARELLAPVYGWFTEGVRYARFEGSEGAAGGLGVGTSTHFLLAAASFKQGGASHAEVPVAFQIHPRGSEGVSEGEGSSARGRSETNN